MKKIYFMITTLLFFMGCSSKEFYTIGDTTGISTKNPSTQVIAVEMVKLPIYMMDSPIYKKDTPHHLVKLDNANWINTMDKQLTQTLITYLQKSQNNPNIHTYPWSSIHKPVDKKVTVEITNFIAYNSKVTLEANYQILDKKTNQSINQLFHTEEKLSSDSVEEIIQNMEKTYFTLVEEINSKL
ncbi:MAG: ABC-type transport auxiliary lipoprotein family protein [Epsilonproteobacteria bacterium]|nr:ABC-type transport auxiliary lipoprotein family protein [Campylobacterota bacterium]